jgi:hypothetical protein
MSDISEGQMESWPEYRRLVLAELVRLNQTIINLDTKLESRDRDQRKAISRLEADVLTLKLKASMWGAAAGMVGSFIVSVIVALMYHLPMK